ncbi:MAG: DUF402 domain-containing protein [Chloroflexi bacterium]|nr:DUF402 domain-containing protein [Chloroflexota bacterium]
MPAKLPWSEQAKGFRAMSLREADYTFIDASWHTTDTLWLTRPGDSHSVGVYWEAGGDRLLQWYVNMQEPLRRTAIGFDSSDLILDLVVAPDLTSWHWKDEDELVLVVDKGWISAERAHELRTEGEQVIDDVRHRRSPFGDGWDQWRPDPTWPKPTIPDNWDQTW